MENVNKVEKHLVAHRYANMKPLKSSFFLCTSILTKLTDALFATKNSNSTAGLDLDCRKRL